jgi:hypothetical protein
MTAMAPATSSQRKCRFPCFEILPSLSLPPVECCLGTKPIHAARLRPTRTPSNLAELFSDQAAQYVDDDRRIGRAG